VAAPQPIDVLLAGQAKVVCCWKVDDALVDPGPSSTLPTLRAALGGEAPRRLLLTHIHLDHAGAAGTLVREHPDLEVWVSERGAPHLVDPSRLVASASRLYGDDMDRLWGEIAPVPEANLRVLRGGERIDGWTVAATPGHASHHLSFLHEEDGWAYVGDTGGVRVEEEFVFPPTPPPDVDLEAWRRSLELIGGWAPQAVAVTHFGVWRDVEAHLARMRASLERWAELARRVDGDTYVAAMHAALASAVDARAHASFVTAVPPEQQWAGLERYWRKRADAP
jgi:glyoxylase-like metal-dependent hydrolase (beta-lactamase superfamily II)